MMRETTLGVRRRLSGPEGRGAMPPPAVLDEIGRCIRKGMSIHHGAPARSASILT
jgi:hypothetical protein